MIIKIHQACSTKNAMFYNERKVEKHYATFYHSKNTPEINPFLGDKNSRYSIFKEIESRNTRVRKPGLHISVNPTVSDLVRLGEAGIRTEIGNLMKHLGYENQPYLVYKHADLERVHFHIISTRINCDTGKKITDSYEKEKTQRFIKDLEQKYQLTKDESQEKLDYRFSGSSKNLKQNLESLFGQLNRMEFITSREMYEQALKLFNVEVRKAGLGYSVFIIDGNGNPIRHPVRMGDFEEKPRFLNETKTLGPRKDMSNSLNPFNSTNENEFLKELKIQVLRSLTNQRAGELSNYNKINKVNQKRKRHHRKI